MDEQRTCDYCGAEHESADQLTNHLTEQHDRDELSRVDRKRVEQYNTESARPLNRRRVMKLPGAGALGIAGITVGVAQQSGLSSSDLPGLGTEDNPTEISDFGDLLTIDDDLEANYVLVDDINASSKDPIEPFGSDSDPFTGTLDGQGNEITGLKITGTGDYSSSATGLFKEIGDDGRVESL